MRKYPVKDSNGNIYNMSSIGVNHTAGNAYIGGNASSYNGVFDNEDKVNIETGIGDIRYCTIGEVREAYEILKSVLENEKPKSFPEYAFCVIETVLKYFGDYTNTNERLSYFPDEEDIDYYQKEHGKVSDLAHKNAAMCIERAMLSQNLLKGLGFNSTFKVSGVIINGNHDAHAYNLVQVNDKYYLFDATIPTIRDGIISPIICEIPKETYDLIINPSDYVGKSIHVNHYNPLQNKDYDITYDAGREEIFDSEKYFIK